MEKVLGGGDQHRDTRARGPWPDDDGWEGVQQ